MLFVGGSTSITHMHFDMDMSHILHTQFMGRKKVLMLAAFLFFISAVGSASAHSLFYFILARILGGIAVGIASILSPMYIAELAPAKYRGTLVSLNQLAIVVGILVAFFSNWLLVDTGVNPASQTLVGSSFFNSGISVLPI